MLAALLIDLYAWVLVLRPCLKSARAGVAGYLHLASASSSASGDHPGAVLHRAAS